MPVNADKPHLWKPDIAQSVDFYNNWFIQFAPSAYRTTRATTTEQVSSALKRTGNLTDISPTLLRQHPEVLPILRMVTAPPIARDRLIGLARVSPNLVKNMEGKQRIPPRMNPATVESELQKIGQIVMRLADKDICPWLETGREPTDAEITRASTIVADRLCGALCDPIIRNAQEQRQLSAIKQWLEPRGYSYLKPSTRFNFETIPLGTFSFRRSIPVRLQSGRKQINIPIDIVLKPLQSAPTDLPILMEAKSAGDYANPNKRRKEEAIKMAQLRNNYGNTIRYILLLCGYFDSGYLGYEAAEGLDWIWEHRLDDLVQLGV